MPFPSAGCRTCKIRRIKCDETQPVCQRCVKSQRICYGMKAGQVCSVVHIENPYASGQKKRPRGPRSTRTVELTDHLNAGRLRPVVDLKTQAISYYLHYHLRALKDVTGISKGASDDFMPIWTSRADCLILDLAISSMALAVFSRKQRHPLAAVEATATYHRLLQVIQLTIPSLHRGNIDDCLFAIYFMSRYEDIIHRPSPKTPTAGTVHSFSHHDGALAILKIWKDQMSHSQPATDVIKHTRRGVIRSALLRSLALPEWMLDGTLFGERGLELEYDYIVTQIAGVRQRLATLLKRKTGAQRTYHVPSSTIEALSKEAQEIDKALQDWASHFPRAWYPQRHTLSDPHPWPTRDFYSSIVCSYSSPAYAAVWSQYHSTRLLIKSMRLRLLGLYHPNLDDFTHRARSECLARMKITSNELASSLPFCLQRFTVADSPNPSYPHQDMITLNTNEDIKPYMATLAVWPLTIASILREVEPSLKLWFQSELAHLGRVIGSGILVCAENDQWLQL